MFSDALAIAHSLFIFVFIISEYCSLKLQARCFQYTLQLSELSVHERVLLASC